MRHLLEAPSGILAPAASVTLAVVLICGLLAAPCYAGKVQSWTGADADFNRYKTYQWLPVRVLTKTGVIEDDEVAAPLIRKAVNRQLALRGLKEVKEAGDLQISA